MEQYHISDITEGFTQIPGDSHDRTEAKCDRRRLPAALNLPGRHRHQPCTEQYLTIWVILKRNLFWAYRQLFHDVLVSYDGRAADTLILLRDHFVAPGAAYYPRAVSRCSGAIGTVTNDSLEWSSALWIDLGAVSGNTRRLWGT